MVIIIAETVLEAPFELTYAFTLTFHYRYATLIIEVPYTINLSLKSSANLMAFLVILHNILLYLFFDWPVLRHDTISIS